MPHTSPLENRVKAHRIARGWSQDALAQRSGISRAGVSAIETGRLVPSAAAALALAAAFDCAVEDIFSLSGGGHPLEPEWAWPPQRPECRYWLAEVSGWTLRVPVEAGAVAATPHDGRVSHGVLREAPAAPAERTLVLASCDPAAGLLAAELWQRAEVRLVVVPRSSRQALGLLREGRVHLAGVHLAEVGGRRGNADAVAEELGVGYRLLRAANWEEGLALVPGLAVRSVGKAVRAKLRWIGRERGSGARECLDEIRGGRPVPKRLARDHRGVAEALRSGWADAGVCLRLVSEEAGLDFHSIRREAYDLCYHRDLDGDPRLHALTQLLRSPAWRGLLADLPGYDASQTGEVATVG